MTRAPMTQVKFLEFLKSRRAVKFCTSNSLPLLVLIVRRVIDAVRALLAPASHKKDTRCAPARTALPNPPTTRRWCRFP